MSNNESIHTKIIAGCDGRNSNVAKLKDSNIYPKVKSILTKYKKNNLFVVGVSGGPDSLALTALANAVAEEKKYKFF